MTISLEGGSTTEFQVRQSCRIYHLWPQGIELKHIALTSANIDGANIKISVLIRTFVNRPNFAVPAKPVDEESSFSYVILGREIGYWQGNVISSDGSPGSPISNISPIRRREGEIDISVGLGGDYPAGAAMEVSRDLLDVAIPFFTFFLGERIVPIEQLLIDEFHTGQRKIHAPMTIHYEPEVRQTLRG